MFDGAKETLTEPIVPYRGRIFLLLYSVLYTLRLIQNEANPDGDYESTIEFGEMFASNFRRFCKPLGINDLSAPAIEENYIKLLAKLTDHFDAYPYFLGHR